MAPKSDKYVHLHDLTSVQITGVTVPELGNTSTVPVKAILSGDGGAYHTTGYIHVLVNGRKARMQLSIWVDNVPGAADPKVRQQVQQATVNAAIHPTPTVMPLPAAQHTTPTAAPNAGREYPPVHQDVQGGYPDNATLARMYPGIGAHNKGKTCMSVCCEGARKAQHRKALKDGTVPQVQTATVQATAPTPAVVQAAVSPNAAAIALIQQQQAQLSAMLASMGV